MVFTQFAKIHIYLLTYTTLSFTDVKQESRALSRKQPPRDAGLGLPIRDGTNEYRVIKYDKPNELRQWQLVISAGCCLVSCYVRTIASSSSGIAVVLDTDAVAPENTALERHNVHSMYCAKRPLAPMHQLQLFQSVNKFSGSTPVCSAGYLLPSA